MKGRNSPFRRNWETWIFRLCLKPTKPRMKTRKNCRRTLPTLRYFSLPKFNNNPFNIPHFNRLNTSRASHSLTLRFRTHSTRRRNITNSKFRKCRRSRRWNTKSTRASRLATTTPPTTPRTTTRWLFARPKEAGLPNTIKAKARRARTWSTSRWRRCRRWTCRATTWAMTKFIRNIEQYLLIYIKILKHKYFTIISHF